MRDWKWGFTLVHIFILIDPTLAASFDCAKVTTQIERTICADEELSKLDDTLAESFSSESESEERAQKLKLDQRAWISVRNRCTDATCLKQRYEDRIADLSCNKNSRMSGSAIGSNQCSSFQLRVLERQLTPLLLARTKDVLASSNNLEHTKKVLADEEHAWRAYRDAQCALYGATEGGSDGWKNAFAGMCIVDETKKRIDALKSIRKSR